MVLRPPPRRKDVPLRGCRTVQLIVQYNKYTDCMNSHLPKYRLTTTFDWLEKSLSDNFNSARSNCRRHTEASHRGDGGAVSSSPDTTLLTAPQLPHRHGPLRIVVMMGSGPYPSGWRCALRRPFERWVAPDCHFAGCDCTLQASSEYSRCSHLHHDPSTSTTPNGGVLGAAYFCPLGVTWRSVGWANSLACGTCAVGQPR